MSSMNECSYCHRQIRAASKFCKYCGQSLKMCPECQELNNL
ncbi:MAG: zinc ribbon domain-containing protein, partial [Candidatus Heimdallarchaeota archaeon]|nr:zinc ribbon domain-containing protein [Candidatus Heimdallarchaeota archaeon]MCK4769069.1 zinc ribbon domain-containing protein [Candidatus Heimdallarchaeota archaeon]